MSNTSVLDDSALSTFYFSGSPLSNFSTLDLTSLGKEVSQMKATTSIVDPVPTCLFKACFSCFGHVVLSIVNYSLCSGVVPAAFKIAAVTPVPKKMNVELDNFHNYHPISNLPFLAKILERTVTSQLYAHLTINNLFEPLQSGFCKFHSTETALVKVTNDLLLACYLHSILLTCMESVFCITETALHWFKSYLTDRRQFVSMGGRKSKIGSVKFGVPQGSILSPVLFSMYIFPLGHLLQSLGLKYHFYADNTLHLLKT